MVLPIVVEDVKREVKILKELTDHENVVQFYNAFEDDSYVYIVMELCEGGELLDRILGKKDNRYTEKDAAVVVRRMLKVVAQCHLHGLVHRDMKPEVRSKPSRPHYFSNKNRMPIKRRLTFGPQIIDPYENDMHNPELSSLAIIEFRQIPIIRINDPMDAGLYIGDTCLAYGIRGLVFLLGREYHQVGNPVVRKLSNQSQRPIIIEDPSANQFLGYDALRNKYKVIRFMNLEDEEDEGTVIHCFTIGLEGISTHFVPTISPFL